MIDTGRSTFLDKGQAIDVTVDGSKGARLTPRNGVVLQVMEDDDPGPVPTQVDPADPGSIVLLNSGVYREPTGDPAKVADLDVTAVHDDDAVATFTDIDLTGNFYNGIRGNNPPGPFGPGLAGKNMVLTFDHASVRGVLSASRTRHAIDTITAADYKQIGEVTNTVAPVVNNGVVVRLTKGARWTVTGTSHLSSLALDAGSSVRAPSGKSVSMTVDGVPTPITAGATYTGAIVVTVG